MKKESLQKEPGILNIPCLDERDGIYAQRCRITRAVYHRIVQKDDFLPYTCAGSSAVLQGIMRHFGHYVGRTGVTPVEQGPDGEQVHVVVFDDRYVYDSTYTQFRRLRVFGSPVILRRDFETRFLLLPVLYDPLMCEPDFFTYYLHKLGYFDPKT